MTDSDKFKNLDSWRGLAAIVVLLSHAYQIFISSFFPASLKFVGLFSQASVMVFFVLSGFLIGLSIRNNKIRNGSFIFKEYAKARFVRIYPPLVFSLCIMVFLYILSPFLFDSGSHKLIGLSSTIPNYYSLHIDLKTVLNISLFRNGFFSGGAQSNAALWSLPYEVWYYIVAGLIMLRGWIGTIASVSLVCFLSYKNNVFAYYGIVWCCGFMLSMSQGFISEKLSSRKHILIISFLSAISVFMCCLYIESNTKQNLINYNISIGFLFSAYLSFYICYGKLAIPDMSRSAEHSYTLYVVHFPILLFIYGCFESDLNESLPLSIAIFIAASTVSIITAKISCKIFENKKLITSAIPMLK